MTEERWKAIPGYEGLYEASDLGRIRSVYRVVIHRDGQVRRYQSKVLKPTPDKKGYPMVVLSKSARLSTFFVHRLVLLAFVGPRPAGMVVRHFPDPDPANNRLSNIRYGTPAENSADQIVHGTHTKGDRNGTAKLSTADVLAIKEALKNRRRGTAAALAKKYKVSTSTISFINLGKAWRTVLGQEVANERDE